MAEHMMVFDIAVTKSHWTIITFVLRVIRMFLIVVLIEITGPLEHLSAYVTWNIIIFAFMGESDVFL